MTLPEISIRRPVFATVLSLAILLIGLMAWSRLPVREYPKIDEPVVSVETTFRGASAEIMESQVTQVLEDSLSGIEGIDVITSVSREQQSQISVRFRITRDPDAAAADVRDRVGRVRRQLPDGIDEPVIAKVEADAQPIIYLAFASDRHSPLEVTDYADRYVKDRLQSVPGVADVRIFGERRYAMRIWLDRIRLAAYGLTPQDVEVALRRQNIEVPAGRIEGERREFTVLSETDLRTAQEFNDLILREAGGYLIRLRDVGRAELGPRAERVITRYNGNSAVALGVVKQATANPLEVSTAIQAALPQITAALPEGMRVDVGYDSSVFIARSITNVQRTIFEAIGLVIVVVFLFLRSFRATLIPLVTIPVSLIGAFALMWGMGFSINTLTLLAMVLAVGLVVDDAIVMLENIARYVEQGMRPFEAALKGSREIAFAVIAMTITLAAVYAPIGFQTGRTGRLFVEFALTLAGAVIVSGFVALSLSPMMCAKMLRANHNPGWFYRVTERGLNAMAEGYKALLRFVLTIKAAVILGMCLVGAVAWVLFRMLPSELSPVEDRGVVFNFMLGPDGATVEYTDRYARALENVFSNQPVINRFFLIVGFPVVSNAIAFAGLRDWNERSVSQQQVTNQLRGPMFMIPGVLAIPSNPLSLGQSPLDAPVQFVLQTSAPYTELQRANDALLGAAFRNPRLINPRTDLYLNKPQLSVQIDREKAANLGIDVETIGRTLETMLGGRQVTRFKLAGKQYDVIVQVADVDRSNPRDITEIHVRARSGEMIPLSNLATVTENVAPRELNHFNKLRSATITAIPAPGYTLGEALDFLQGQFAELQRAGVIPPTVTYDLGGPSREFRSATGGLYITFLLALAFIYLVLAAQFESFIDPFIIMLTVPLSMAGALAALLLTGNTINVYSQIGLVTLVGLITKHGILIVEFANQLQERGQAKLEAVIEAAGLRLRPILMTTGAMVLGAVPLALSTGAGAESRQTIGWVIVGGMSLGTLLTLFVVPVAYVLLARTHKPAEPEAKPAAPQPSPAPAE
jgi:multidrug efflux pump